MTTRLLCLVFGAILMTNAVGAAPKDLVVDYPPAKVRFRVLSVSRDGVHSEVPTDDQKFRFRLRSIGWENDPKRAVETQGTKVSAASFDIGRDDIAELLAHAVPPGSVDLPLRAQLELKSVSGAQPKSFDLELEVAFERTKVKVRTTGAIFAVLHLWKDHQGEPHAEIVAPLSSPNEKTPVPFYFPQFKISFCLDAINGEKPKGKFAFGLLGSNRKWEGNFEPKRTSQGQADTCSEPFAFSSTEINHGLVVNGQFLYPFRYPISIVGSFQDFALKQNLKAKYRLRANLTFVEKSSQPVELSYELMPFEDDIRRGFLTFGFQIWRNRFGEPEAASFASYNARRYYAPVADLKAVSPPKQFTIVDGLFADNDLRNWKEGFTHLKALGINTVGTGLHFNSGIRQLALDAGIPHFTLKRYRPLESNFEFFQQPDKLSACRIFRQKDYDAFARELVDPVRAAGLLDSDIGMVSIADEPIWPYPFRLGKCQDARIAAHVNERFREFLKSIAKREDLPYPQAFGSAQPKAIRPLFDRKLAKSIPARRLFYWTTRFFPWYSAEHYAKTTQAIQNLLKRPDLKVFANWNHFTGETFRTTENEPNSQFVGSGNHDWFEFAKNRGTTLPWSEDWMTDQDNHMWSFTVNLLRSASSAAKLPDFGGYIVGRQSDYTHQPIDGGILRRALTLVGNGAKTIEYYLFGPEYLAPANSYSDDVNVQRKIAEANSMIAESEDLTFPGTTETARVGLVLPLSANAWHSAGGKDSAMDWYTERAYEVTRLFLALKNSNVPVQFIHEDDLLLAAGQAYPEALKSFQLIYLTESNLPVRAKKGLEAWVTMAGGTLATVAGAGYHDEYDLESSFLDDPKFFGVKETLVTSRQVGPSHLEGDVWVKPYGHATCENCSDVALQTLNIKVVARFSDKSPAILQRQVGRGNVIHFTWLVGASYFLGKHQPSIEDANKLPEDFSEVLREWIVYPLKVSQFVPSLTLSSSLVEALPLRSEQGAAIVLINWRNQAIPKLRVTLDPRRWEKITCVKSVKRGVLQMTEDSKTRAMGFDLSLDAGDIVRMYYGQTSQCRP